MIKDTPERNLRGEKPSARPARGRHHPKQVGKGYKPGAIAGRDSFGPRRSRAHRRR